MSQSFKQELMAAFSTFLSVKIPNQSDGAKK